MGIDVHIIIMMLWAAVLAALVAGSQASVNFQITERWYGGFKFAFTFTPSSTVDNWAIDLQLNGNVDEVQCDWGANANKVSSNHYRLTNLPSNGHVDAGQSIKNLVVVQCHEACATGNQYNLQLADSAGGSSSGGGGNTGGNPGGNTGGGGGGSKDYADALAKSILFYDAQRSGRLPANNPVHWRGNSALGDCVVGGWYDAGDHVKFGLPFGYSAHVLLWGLQKFKDGYEAAGQLDMMYDMVKWATDYMLGAYNMGNHELVAQIGNGDADHAFWGKPEDMTMGRPCYKVGPGKPAADLYGEWAGALAAASMVWKDKDVNRKWALEQINYLLGD